MQTILPPPPLLPLSPVTASGAGDGYNAAYLSSFIISNNPQIALNEASKIGAKIVMKKGAIVNVK